MSYREPPFYLSKGAFGRFNGVVLEGAVAFQGVNIQGNTPEINRTVLSSPRTETAGGIPDSGAVSCNLLSAPHSPIFYELDQSNDGSKVRTLEIFVGGIPTNGRETDGREIEIVENLDKTKIKTATSDTSPPGDTSVIAIEEQYAREEMNGVCVGDFFRIGNYSETAANYHRITNINTRPQTIGGGSTQYIFFDTDEASVSYDPDAAANASTLSIVRPALKYTLPTYAMNVGQGFNTGGLIDMQVTFRIVSRGTRLVGRDGRLENAYAATMPSLPFTNPPSGDTFTGRHYTLLS